MSKGKTKLTAKHQVVRRREPRRLSGGKKFHKKVQAEWIATAEGHVHPEKTINVARRRKGRIDIYVRVDKELSAIVEIKNSRWDRMSLASLRRNVRRYSRQVWSYIHAELRAGKNVSPGVLFAKQPTSSRRLALIEQLFEAEGIPCVWQDETVVSCRRRRVKAAK